MDVNPTANPPLKFLLAQAPTAVAPVSTVPADDGAVARFQRRLAGSGAADDLAGPQDLGGIDAEGDGQRKPAGYRNVGDAILDGLDALSSQVQRAWNGVRGVDPMDPQQPLDPNAPPDQAGVPKISELMAMQRDMVEFSLMFEAMGKGTSKTIDNTNQLVKMQ